MHRVGHNFLLNIAFILSLLREIYLSWGLRLRPSLPLRLMIFISESNARRYELEAMDGCDALKYI